MNFDNTNSGALFPNDKKGNEKRPDYKGTVNVNGTDYWLSGWIKSSKAGAKYMSLSVQPKERADTDGLAGFADPPAKAPDFNDEIPF